MVYRIKFDLDGIIVHTRLPFNEDSTVNQIVTGAYVINITIHVIDDRSNACTDVILFLHEGNPIDLFLSILINVNVHNNTVAETNCKNKKK